MHRHVSDETILATIRALANEERTLHERAAPTSHDWARIEKIRVELDRCWDLLRQRRARREFGQDPDGATVRPASVVENYEQ